MESLYIFDRMDMALYVEGAVASDYLPVHAMEILSYEDKDLILDLVIHCESGSVADSKFAWVKYVLSGESNEEEDDYEVEEVYEAEFKDGKLPSKSDIGLIIFRKLTGR